MENEQWTDYKCTPPCNRLLCKFKPISEPYAFEIKCPGRKCHNINYHGNVISINLTELRCAGIDTKRSAKAGEDIVCGKLLARILPGTQIQIKCPRCGTITETHLTDNKDNHTNEENK
ncbi:Com family DNA-binding transcriptional regulator [Acinetobacter sp.]|uniref:Com family DNA-binding transcriptional regulator n=1 Tax=Acinetobacter sp. TaxID=472 RepID=UPI003D02BC80